MPKSTNQKQKMLLILDYLQKHTDETHDATTPQLIDYLAANGIKAERKSIYNDIQTLIDFGYDIVRGPGPHDGYQLLSRDFELAEVKLLVDLVQSSKFITTKKSASFSISSAKTMPENCSVRLSSQTATRHSTRTSTTVSMSSMPRSPTTGRSAFNTSTGMSKSRWFRARPAQSTRSARGFSPGTTGTTILSRMTVPQPV